MFDTYEEDGVLYRGNDTYTTSAIDTDNPEVPPLGYQHDLICGAMQKPTPARLLQVGVGYGAVAYSLSALGYKVDALDLDLSSVFEYKSRVNFIETRYQDYRPSQAYDVIVIDMCAPFHSGSWYTEGIFDHAKTMLKQGGLVVFNMGPWLHYSYSVLSKVVNTYRWYSMLPESSVLLCSDVPLNCTRSPEYPDWLIIGQQLHHIKP